MRRHVVRAIIPAGAPRALIGVSELWRSTPDIQICAGAGLFRRAPVGVQAATCAPHLEQQSREVIALSATGPLGMAAPGQIRLTVVSLAERGRSHGIRHFKLDAWRSRRPTPLGEAPASRLAAVTLNRTRQERRDLRPLLSPA